MLLSDKVQIAADFISMRRNSRVVSGKQMEAVPPPHRSVQARRLLGFLDERSRIVYARKGRGG